MVTCLNHELLTESVTPYYVTCNNAAESSMSGKEKSTA